MIYLKQKDNWIEVGEGQKVKVDYLTIAQGEKLTEMKYEALGRYLTSGEGVKVDLVKLLAYKRYFLKCVIKDWIGFEVECKLKDNELEDDIWWALVRNENVVNYLFDLINPILEFSIEDKKKSSSLSGSLTTDTIEETEKNIP